MARLSVNVNKVATLRNARGGQSPDLRRAVQTCIDAGATGITVHPRADERHITTQDVVSVAELLAPLQDRVEYNIEGDPRADWVDLVRRVKPHQCTLVPVRPGELTSEAGWPSDTPRDTLGAQVDALKADGVRVSVFVEPRLEAIGWAKAVGADRVELYTEPYARAFNEGGAAFSEALSAYAKAAAHASELGLGINAGHDLDRQNLPPLLRIGLIDEVSIGHALISEALFEGLDNVVRSYLSIIADCAG